MTVQKPGPHRLRVGIVITVIAVVVLAVAGGVVLATRPPAPTSSGSTPTPNVTSSSPAPTPSDPSPSPSPSRTAPRSSDRPTPQPTKTTSLKDPTTIRKELTARVTRLESVSGKAAGPGEIAGPSVRFTISITNGTDSSVNLSNTVVNCFYGADDRPAIRLENPGGRAFPQSVKRGRTVTGIYIFNIPTAARKTVKVTVDTSVRNPVVAFRGSAPK